MRGGRGLCTYRAAALDCTIQKTSAAGQLDFSEISLAIARDQDGGITGKARLDAEGTAAGLLTASSWFVSNPGLAPEHFGGSAKLSGTIAFPLSRLAAANVEADLTAKLGPAGLGSADSAAAPRRFNIATGEVRAVLRQGRAEMRGEARINAIPVRFNWRRNTTDPAAGWDAELNMSLDSKFLERSGVFLPFQAEVPARAAIRLRGANGGFTGKVSLDITDSFLWQPQFGWSKPAGDKAQASFEVIREASGALHLRGVKVSGDRLNLEGEISFNPAAAVQRASLPVIRIGDDNDFSLAVERGPEGKLHIDVEARRFDLRPFLRQATGEQAGEDSWEAGRETGQALDFVFDARLGEGIGFNGVAIRDSRLRFHSRAGLIYHLDLQGQIVGEAVSPITARLRRSDDQRRRLDITSGDAGAVLRGLDFYSDIKGGELDITANIRIDPGDNAQIFEGEVAAKKFRLVNAPGFAQVLSLASLTGIRDSLNDRGIAFENLKIPFALTPQRIDLGESWAVGPALGTSFSGNYIRAAPRSIALQGTLTPAYALNSFLGGLPIIGPLFGGGRGKGLLGLTFALEGNEKAVTARVHPLSILAPGFLRGLFEFRGETPPRATPGLAPSPS